MLELKKTFVNKIDLLRRSRFLPKNVHLWDACTNSDLLYSIKKFHCRAAKIVYNLSKDKAS